MTTNVQIKVTSLHTGKVLKVTQKFPDGTEGDLTTITEVNDFNAYTAVVHSSNEVILREIDAPAQGD